MSKPHPKDKVKTHPNYSTDLKERIVKAKMEGNLSFAKVAKQFSVPVSTVKKMVKKYMVTGTVESDMKGKCGGSRKTTPRMERHLVISAKKNPFQTHKHLQELAEGAGTSISRSVISRRLNEQGLFSRKPRKTPFHRKIHLKRRKKFCLEHIGKPLSFWRRQMYTDETKLELWGPGECSVVIRPKNQELNPKFTLKTIKHPISLMLWGSIGANGVGTLHRLEKGVRMTGQIYVDILKKNLEPSRKKLGLGGRGKNKWIFQQGKVQKRLGNHGLFAHVSCLSYHFSKVISKALLSFKLSHKAFFFDIFRTIFQHSAVLVFLD